VDPCDWAVLIALAQGLGQGSALEALLLDDVELQVLIELGMGL
jgi:hypothetical protein